MKRLFFIITLFLASPAYGASLEYSSIVDSSSPLSSVVVKYGGLEDKKNYECSISTLFCVATTTEASYSKMLFDYSFITDKRVIFRGHSESGRFVFYYQYADTNNKNHRYMLLDTLNSKTYEQESAVNFLDLMTEQDRLFSISPDEKTLLYLDDREGSPAIYSIDLTQLKKNLMKGKRLTKTKYTVADFIAYDKDTVYFIANRTNPLVWSLYRYSIKKEKLEKIADDISYGGTLKKVSENIIALQVKGSAVVPLVYNTESKKISYFLLPQTAGIESVAPPYKIVHYGSLYGTLSYPETSDETKHPLIVWLHGGPYRQASLTYHSYFSYGVYDWILNEARKNGAIVFKLDYSGSYGYGTNFIESLKGKVGKKDVSDVVTALASAKKEIAKKYDVSGVYLVGNSYGGYLALRSLVAYPKQFSGAYSINSVTDWPTLLVDLETSTFNEYFKGIPDEKNTALYDKADILLRATDVLPTQKITLVQAQNDTTINPIQAQILRDSWKGSGVTVDLLSIPDEEHVFHKVSSITAICKSLFGFLGVALDTNICEYK